VNPQLKQNPGTNAKKTGKSPDTDITTGINQQQGSSLMQIRQIHYLSSRAKQCSRNKVHQAMTRLILIWPMHLSHP
jgi:hypothetical protein